jgi:hypothetical protein
MERLLLGAYQILDAAPYGDDEQFGPKAMMVKLTTAIDQPFVNRTVTAILSAEDQQSIITLFTDNLKE